MLAQLQQRLLHFLDTLGRTLQEHRWVSLLVGVGPDFQEAHLFVPLQSCLDGLFVAWLQEWQDILLVESLETLMQFLDQSLLFQDEILASDFVDGDQHYQVGVHKDLNYIPNKLKSEEELLVDNLHSLVRGIVF